MAGEDKGQVQDQASQEGADQQGTEAQEALPGADVQAQISALRQELAAQKAAREVDRRQMQGKIDKDIARERARADERAKAQKTYVRERMEQAGASSEELATFEADLGRFAEGLSDKEKAARFDEMMVSEAEQAQIREIQESIIKGITDEFDVDIPLDHPDLKKDSPAELSQSALKLAKKLLADKAKQEGKDTLTKAAGTGALGALGTGPGGVVNPIAGITDPTELLKMGFKKKKK